MKHIIATLLIALAVSVSAQERTSALKDLSNVQAEDMAAAVNAAIAEAPAASRAAMHIPAIIHASDYGATFDGVTDDTAAIQEALDAAASLLEPCEVVFPPGTAIISSALTISGRYGLRIRGAGPEVTTIRQTSVNEHGFQYRYNDTLSTDFIEFLEIRDMLIEGPGLATSNGYGLMMHDDTLHSNFFNGGSFKLDNVKIGNNGKGFHTALYLKRWDTSTISHCRFLYNYRSVYLDTFTHTVTFIGCGISQAESVLWDVGKGAKVNLIGCDNGNAPQWARVGSGARMKIIGCNFESQIYSLSAPRKYNIATSTYPGVTSVSSVNTTTGLFTTSGNHGFKPGCAVNFGYATIPTGLSVAESYTVLADGFSATTFKVAPIARSGAVASGSPNITVSGTKTNTDDLAIGGKVMIYNQSDTDAFTPGEYWIVGKPTSSTLTVSGTEGGSAISFTQTGSLWIEPTTALVPSTSGASVTVFLPAFALEHSATVDSDEVQFTGSGGSPTTAPIACLGTGCYFYSNGLWHSSGYSGTFGGRVVVTGNNCFVEGKTIPVTLKQSTDALIAAYTTGNWLVQSEDSGYASNSTRRTQFHARINRAGMGADDRLFWQCSDRFGNFTNEPILNRDARLTTVINSGTAATPFELKPNTKYRVNFPAAAADIVLNLPDDSSTGEQLIVDDEIEIFVVNANGQTVKVQHGGATSTIRFGSTVTTAGTGKGMSLVIGDAVTLKCYDVSGQGYWQATSVVGTPGTF